MTRALAVRIQIDVGIQKTLFCLILELISSESSVSVYSWGLSGGLIKLFATAPNVHQPFTCPAR
jgi:hypothetical protein